MKFLPLVMVLGVAVASPFIPLAGGPLQKRDCQANNCIRAVRNTKSLEGRSADCSSYLLGTVFPDATTITGTSRYTEIPATSTVSLTATTVVETSASTTISTTTTVQSTEVVLSVTTASTIATVVITKRALTVVPSSVPGYASGVCPGASYASACSCLGITRSTTTIPRSTVTRSTSVATTLAVPVASVTSTVTQITTITTNTITATLTSQQTTTFTSTSTFTTTSLTSSTTLSLCGNSGLEYAVYDNPSFADDNQYSNFDPTVFKQVTPLSSGSTNAGGFSVGSRELFSFYGSPPVLPEFKAINHRGYIYAYQTGAYVFSVSKADDIVLVWFGSVAYSGWTRSNAGLTAVLAPATTTVNLVAGQWFPLRVVYGNAQGFAAFGLTIQAPDGSIILSSSTGPSSNLVRFSCDGTSAGPFEPFGSEM